MIELGKALPLIDKTHKIEENIIKGCQSKVWIHAHLDGDKVKFTADNQAERPNVVPIIIVLIFAFGIYSFIRSRRTGSGPGF